MRRMRRGQTKRGSATTKLTEPMAGKKTELKRPLSPPTGGRGTTERKAGGRAPWPPWSSGWWREEEGASLR
jgi:hypothetical protein